MTTKINLDEKFSRFSEHWRPKVIASLNGQELKLIKVKGEFPWHHHEQEDDCSWYGRVNFAWNSGTKLLHSAPENAL